MQNNSSEGIKSHCGFLQYTELLLRRRKLSWHALAVLFLFCATKAQASPSVTLAWNPSPDLDVIGYKSFYGTASGDYTTSIDVGNHSSVTFSNLVDSETYFAVVTAYTAAALQSLPSNEVSFIAPNNLPPAVRLTSPQAGASFDGLTFISLAAIATDSDGSIIKVEFYSDTTKLSEITVAPYRAQWGDAPLGWHLLTALAYDDSGAAVRSAGVQIGVGVSQPGPSLSPGATHLPRITVVEQKRRVTAGTRAMFTVSASGAAQPQATLVSYTVGGSATDGIDYASAQHTGQITIPAGARTAVVGFDTIPTPLSAGNKTVTVTIARSIAYDAFGWPAKVVIVDEIGLHDQRRRW